MDTIISLQNISKVYQQEKMRALHNVSLEIKSGEFVSVIGASGCGKSTLLRIIAGLESPDAGTLQKPDHTSMVFQSGALMPWLSVLDNVAFGLGERSPAVEKTAREYLALLGLADFAARFPRELSGGQRQRVGIARALATKPEVLLMDEPFSALDPKTTHELHEDIIKIWRETKVTVMLVSHLIEEAATLAERVVLMESGAIKEIFPITISYPRHERGHELLAEVEKIRRVFFN